MYSKVLFDVVNGYLYSLRYFNLYLTIVIIFQLSIYGGSAWTYDSERGLVYYHKFHTSMPDLNHRDKYFQDEVHDMMTFWLSQYNLDGLVLADVHLYFEADDTTLDEPTSDLPGVGPVSLKL